MAVTVSSFARLHFTNELATAQKRFVSRLRRTQTKVGDARMRALLTARKVQACALRGESWKIAETTLDAGADGTDYRTKEMVLVEDDVKLLTSLINDLFNQARSERAEHPGVSNVIKRVTVDMGLQVEEAVFEKVIQLYETSLVRHGIMVIGPAASGKSMIYEVLLRALSQVDRPHKAFRMNPKAITDKEVVFLLVFLLFSMLAVVSWGNPRHSSIHPSLFTK